MSDPTVLISVDLRIEEEQWNSEIPEISEIVERALVAAGGGAGESGLVEVLLTNDTEMHALNSKWRGKDKPTDVLSFPAEGATLPGMQPFIGDIAIGLDVAKVDSDKLGRDFQLHVMHLLVHGFLHLVGFDHISEDDAKKMEGLEAKILAPLGLPDPYGDAA